MFASLVSLNIKARFTPMPLCISGLIRHTSLTLSSQWYEDYISVGKLFDHLSIILPLLQRLQLDVCRGDSSILWPQMHNNLLCLKGARGSKVSEGILNLVVYTITRIESRIIIILVAEKS